MLFFGNVDDRKGAGLLFEIAKHLSSVPGVKLIIMGEVSDKYVMEAARYKDSDNIRFMGYLSGNEKNKILCETSCLLFLSRRDSMPFVLVQSMGRGIPIISTWRYVDKIFPKDVVMTSDESATGVLAQVMKLYDLWKSDPDSFQRLSERVKQSSDSDFDRATVMSKIENMFIYTCNY